MRFPVNLVLEIRTQEEYDYIQEGLKLLNATDLSKSPLAFNLAFLRRVVVKLTDGTKESRVLINGQQIAMGTTEEMTKRYEGECAMHQKSNIVLEEWQDGGYKSSKSRRLQRL